MNSISKKKKIFNHSILQKRREKKKKERKESENNSSSEAEEVNRFKPPTRNLYKIVTKFCSFRVERKMIR